MSILWRNVEVSADIIFKIVSLYGCSVSMKDWALRILPVTETRLFYGTGRAVSSYYSSDMNNVEKKRPSLMGYSSFEVMRHRFAAIVNRTTHKLTFSTLQ